MEQWYSLLRSPFASLDPATQQWVYRSFYQFVYKDIYFKTHDRSLPKILFKRLSLRHPCKVRTCNPTSIFRGGWSKSHGLPHWIGCEKKNKNRQISKLAHAYMDAMASHEVSVASAVETKVRDELLHQALAELKEDYRTILILFYIQNKSYRQICYELQLTEPVLTQRLARARKNCSTTFYKNGLFPMSKHHPSLTPSTANMYIDNDTACSLLHTWYCSSAILYSLS